MRLLLVVSRFPYPLGYGDQVRGFHHLRVLSRQHQIVLVSPYSGSGNGEDAMEAVRPFCEDIRLVPTPVCRQLARLACFPFTKLPLQTLYLFDRGFRDIVIRLVRDRHFDVMHVQMIRMAPVVEALLPRIPAVLDFIDALSINMAQRSFRASGPKMVVARWESRRIKNYERSLVRRYDQLVISSPLDRKEIGDYPNLHIVPNGVDIERYPFVTEGRETAMIVFIGTMWYFPNIDAVFWFVNKIFPIIQARMPELRFFIVGARPASSVKRLSRVPGVIVTGYVPRVQEYLRRATVAIAPMKSGTGMQFKVIEAMASGAPVVATPFALGGLEVTNGEHLLVASEAEDFAECMLRLLRDQQLRNRLIHNARKLIEDKYTWERTVEKLESVYHLAIENHRGRCTSNG